jgi:hypothetical protein
MYEYRGVRHDRHSNDPWDNDDAVVMVPIKKTTSLSSSMSFSSRPPRDHLSGRKLRTNEAGREEIDIPGPMFTRRMRPPTIAVID